MLVGTKEVAQLLGVSSDRVRRLLLDGRVHGAYKISNVWVIPLKDGMPVITKGTRGPKPTWKARGREVMTCIHVNRTRISRNYKHGENLPVLSVKHGSSNQYGYEVEVAGPCRVVYRPEQPKDCGAKVWIETLSPVWVA
ncbi:helix-turn-helix domain-containing protein [Laspinema olomoucense]|uniref:helix-turn-helix domain-containing protein n=1 Tax=Laspinema olomoucense TaxID=3231600 RepID=UPI0021BAD79D|nr:helix-turn-helix domain-containing protein [Laspinema sp. D3d]MCT7973037.1 helix-turn-helix domain-containing protein [Laspinema sp. D3d]